MDRGAGALEGSTELIRYLFRRLLATIPTLLGISLVTFVVLNLAMGTRDIEEGRIGRSSTLSYSASFDDRSRYPDRHLPLFLNLSIKDARSHAMEEVDKLKDERRAARAKRVIERQGGAWLPYLVPQLTKASGRQQEHLLTALSGISRKIGIGDQLAAAPRPKEFWVRYWKIHRQDFKAVRAKRLVRRITRREDPLALREIYRLDTFCLPPLIGALDEDLPRDAQLRVVDTIVELTGIDDPLDPGASREQWENVLNRWRGWWSKRYDKYTVFDGGDRLIGAVTETRYFRWVSRIVTFDFGVSTQDGRPILEKLGERLPITLLLSVLSLAFSYLLAIPIGIISAVRRGGIFDRSMMLIVFVLYSLPTFWLAVLLIRFLSSAEYFDWFPAQGLVSPFSGEMSAWKRMVDMAHHLVLPVACLSSVSLAMLTRYQRLGMIQVINLDYMRAAQAKGLSRGKAILRHGLRNGVIPVVTMLGLQIPYLVSGSVIVERIFGIHGMGYETIEAIRSQDQPWLMAVVTVTAIMTMIGVVAADAIYALLDPRITPGRGEAR